MSRPLRVLVVQGHGVLGGAESWLLQMVDATDRLRVDAVSLADGPVVEELRQRGIPTTVLPTGARAVDGLRPAARLRAVLRSEPWDVVLCNGVKAAALGVPVCFATGVPVVWVKHDHSFGARLGRPLARLATAVVVTEEQLLAEVGDGVVVPPPAPPATLDRVTARARLGLSSARPVLAVVGRLVDYKGFDDAVLALRSAPEWDLVVIGADDPADPGERARLERLVAAHDLGARVRFLGRVDDAGRLLSGVDALAVLTKPVGRRGPSVEGFGMTALEAARAGVPVVATAGSPAAERAGIPVPPGDPDAVAAALNVLVDAGVRAALGARARAAVADHPAATQCADRLVGVLCDAARRPGAGLDGPPVSVVVTVRNEEAAVPALLERVLPQLRAEDELVVVDGGSTDMTVAVLRAADDARLTIIESPGAGISEGRNIGIRAARHDVIACTDAGCEPVADWLAELAAAFAEDDAPDLVTGVYGVSLAGPSWWGDALAAVGYPDPIDARRPTPIVRAYGALLGRSYDATLPTGRSMAFRREAWERAGGFPEHLATGEDVTYGRAIVESGGRAVLATGGEVTWAQRSTLAANLRMYRSYGHGDGRSGNRTLIGRNVARAVAYPIGLAMLTGGRTRWLALVGGVAYLSLPLVHAAKRSPASIPVLPLMAAARDGVKVLGCFEGLRDR